MNTNEGFNALAVLIPITTVVTQMPDGTWKWLLLTVLSVAATVVGIKTKGDVHLIENDQSQEDVLKEGRN